MTYICPKCESPGEKYKGRKHCKDCEAWRQAVKSRKHAIQTDRIDAQRHVGKPTGHEKSWDMARAGAMLKVPLRAAQ